MTHEIIICYSTNVFNVIFLLHHVLKILKDFTESIREATFNSSLLLMARNQYLIKLDKQVFIMLFIVFHLISQLQIKVLFQFEESQTLSDNSEVPEQTLNRSKVFSFWMSNALE